MARIRSSAQEHPAIARGATPDMQTIIYIHGIGNKPLASVLKCQWDTALFGVELGDRSRLAYWVNRSFYPTPSDDTCISEDAVHIDDDEITTRSVMALARGKPTDEEEAVAAEISSLTSDPREQAWLEQLSAKFAARGEAAPAGVSTSRYGKKILPLPAFMRRFITRKITRAFLRDVHDYFFDAERRRVMDESFVERLNAGGGPFVIIAHSLGSVIAYNVLRQMRKAELDVRLFVTIGSPLGLSEVQDVLKQWGELRAPECVSRWVNLAEALDPVAADQTIADEYAAAAGQIVEDLSVDNPESPQNPHAATGYLRTDEAREEVLDVVGRAFTQPVARAVIAKDLVRRMEDAAGEARHATLIELSTGKPGSSIDATRIALVGAIEDMVRDRYGPEKRAEDELGRAQIDALRRYVSAKLTRLEIEHLRTHFTDLQIERVWRDAEKRSLVCDSTHTIQCSPAVLGYGAGGQDIGWAVLDTGIRADHPHFERYDNIKRQWDCTRGGAAQELAPGHPAFGTLDKDGHGTHVAAIIAGELDKVVTSDGKERRFSGMAPQTAIYGFKVLDDHGDGHDSWIIKALDIIADVNEGAGRLVIAGVNLSLGGNFDPSVYGCGHTPLCRELRRLWNQGVIVCLAAGNEGYAVLQSEDGELPTNIDLSIGDPANLDEAIAVGSIHKTNPFTYGISYFSSRGPTADGRRKPDLVAPGERILSALNKHKRRRSGPLKETDLYVEMSGTSMAAPHVSGLLAGFLSVRREFIGYPNKVKRILLDNCTDLERDPYFQGRGMPNLIRMLSNN